MNDYDKLLSKYEDVLDEIMLLNEIKENLIHELFDDEKIKLFINSSIKIANELFEKYKDKNINNIITNYGYKIINDEKNKYYFSRLDDKKKLIITTDKYNFLEGKISNITKKKLKQLSIAHEFVHVLELNKELEIDDYNLLIVSKPLIFGLKKRSYTSLIYELIAHQFAKLKTKIKYNPKIIEYIFEVEKNKIKYSELEERLKKSKEYYEKNIIK